MRLFLVAAVTAVLAVQALPAIADDILDAIDQARKVYQQGDLPGAKQSLDLASQLIGQKNAETFVKLLPDPLASWTGEEPQTTAVGAVGFGLSSASRKYSNPKGDTIDVQITGDSVLITQFATLLANPQIAGAMGKLIRIGNQRAIQSSQGDVHVIVNNKFLVMVTGSGSPKDKLAYAGAINFERLSKM